MIVKKYKESVSLLSQFWIKDDSKTIKNLIEETVAKTKDGRENWLVKNSYKYEP